jgi:hypothetical protein
MKTLGPRERRGFVGSDQGRDHGRSHLRMYPRTLRKSDRAGCRGSTRPWTGATDPQSRPAGQAQVAATSWTPG